MKQRPAPDPGGIERSPEASKDLALLERVAAGDRVAFEAIFKRYYSRLFGFVLRMTDDYEIADEVMNDVMFAVWRGAKRFRAQSKPSTWIMGIAYRQTMRHLNRQKRWRRLGRMLGREREVVPPIGLRHEDAQWLSMALTELPAEQRAVVELTYYMERSQEEIAQITGCPVGTVKSRMYHARRKLRPILERLAAHDGEHNEEPE